MKKSDLHREWARVLDMCEGTEVSTGLCWKLNGFGSEQDCIPKFDCDGGRYEFAVAILEDKPVFVGDTLYHKSGYQSRITDDLLRYSCVNFNEYSWTTPKKTFMLNGEELPCPIKKSERTYGFTLGDRRVHFFDSKDKCNTVLDAIDRLLLDNTK